MFRNFRNALTFSALGLSLALAAGCGDDGTDDGADSANADTGTTAGDTTTAGTTATTTTTTGEDTTTGETTGADTTAGDTGDTTAGVMCEVDPQDDECATCVKEGCCAQLMDCQANPDCDCVVQCVGEMGVENLAACQKECEVDALPPEAIPLQTCQAQNCAAECG